MWKFWAKPKAEGIPAVVRTSLAAERGLDAAAVGKLRMLQEHGVYSGRKVTYFRLFDPATMNVTYTHFKQLDAVAVPHAGHIESDGQVVLTRNRL